MVIDGDVNCKHAFEKLFRHHKEEPPTALIDLCRSLPDLRIITLPISACPRPLDGNFRFYLRVDGGKLRQYPYTKSFDVTAQDVVESEQWRSRGSHRFCQYDCPIHLPAIPCVAEAINIYIEHVWDDTRSYTNLIGKECLRYARVLSILVADDLLDPIAGGLAQRTQNSSFCHVITPATNLANMHYLREIAFEVVDFDYLPVFSKARALDTLYISLPSWHTGEPAHGVEIQGVFRKLADAGSYPYLVEVDIGICFDVLAVTGDEGESFRSFVRKAFPSLHTVTLRIRQTNPNDPAANSILVNHLLTLFKAEWDLSGLQPWSKLKKAPASAERKRGVASIWVEAEINEAIVRGQAELKTKRIRDFEAEEPGWRGV